MTRTSSTLILVLATLGAAIAAVPAMASDDYRSVNSIIGGGNGDQAQPQLGDYTSVNAALGSHSSSRSPVSSTDTDPVSLNATLGPNGLAQQSPPVLDGREGDGFDWFDALIGALIASGLTLMTLVAARTVERHRRATAESRA
jgi:hypothetical protein